MTDTYSIDIGLGLDDWQPETTLCHKIGVSGGQIATYCTRGAMLRGHYFDRREATPDDYEAHDIDGRTRYLYRVVDQRPRWTYSQKSEPTPTSERTSGADLMPVSAELRAMARIGLEYIETYDDDAGAQCIRYVLERISTA